MKTLFSVGALDFQEMTITKRKEECEILIEFERSNMVDELRNLSILFDKTVAQRKTIISSYEAQIVECTCFQQEKIASIIESKISAKDDCASLNPNFPFRMLE
jgi:hypothetical protein